MKAGRGITEENNNFNLFKPYLFPSYRNTVGRTVKLQIPSVSAVQSSKACCYDPASDSKHS